MNTVVITAEKITAGGNALARLDGKIIFVPDALPGETLEIMVTEQKRDYARARVVRVLERSPHRIEPRCPLYGACGGCNVQIADYAHQLAVKESIVRDALERAGLPCAPRITVIAGAPWEYRSRIQVHTARQNQCGAAAAGFMARSSRRIIPVDACPVLVPRLNAALASTNFAAAKKERVDLCACYAQYKNTCREIIASSEQIVGGAAAVFMLLCGERVYFDARGFFQSNIPLFESLIQSVLKSLDEEHGADKFSRALDLYSGCGVFARFLQDKFSEVVLVEENEAAAMSAKKNVPRAKIYRMSAKQWLKTDAARLSYDVVIADPPRQGLEKKTRARLCELRPKKLRYVSCDAAAFARDAAQLCANGFLLDALELYDFYPQTSHVELLASFST